MATMETKVREYLTENKSAPFHDIFDHVKTEMRPEWKKRFPNKLLKHVETDKIGELFIHLSVHGSYIKNKEGHWTLTEEHSANELEELRKTLPENIE